MPGGRPLKLTGEVEAAILAYIAKGVSFKDACLMAGVAEDTATKWMQRGRDKFKDQPENAKFRRFRAAVQRAKAAFRGRVALALERGIQGGEITGQRTERVLGKPGKDGQQRVLSEVNEVHRTPANGALALKVLQHIDKKRFKPDAPGQTNIALLLAQVKDSRIAPRDDDVILGAEEVKALPAPTEAPQGEATP